MNKKKSILFTSLFLCVFALVFVIFISRQNTVSTPLDSLELKDIEEIQLSGSTGELNGRYQHVFSNDEIGDFVNLLDKVKLGKEVAAEKAASNGATAYYHITFKNGDKLTLQPGQYFLVNENYYVFKNMDDIWDEFVAFNSLGQ